MPKAWVRILDSPNPKPIRGLQFDKDLKGCETEVGCDPRETEKHDEGTQACIGVAPKVKGNAFVRCMRAKGYASAKIDAGCEERHGKP